MKSISVFLQKGAFSSNRTYRNPLSLIFFTLFLTGFLTLPGSNVKADGGRGHLQTGLHLILRVHRDATPLRCQLPGTSGRSFAVVDAVTHINIKQLSNWNIAPMEPAVGVQYKLL